MTPRLGSLVAGVDPEALRPGVVHFGVGAFHRAHQQTYLDDLARLGETGWGVIGVNTAPPDLRATHAAQRGLYGVLTRDGDGQAARLVSTLGRVLQAGQDLRGDLLADPAISLVTLTITEKGYCHRPGSTDLDPRSAIAADLETPDRPQTAIGILARLLAARRAAGGGGITLASCDNIPDNGRLLAAVLGAYVRETDPGLAGWMEDHVRCPSSMVDRIVPAMNDASRAALAEAVGAPDALGVVAEPFRQWVIEDAFAGPMPGLARVGVQIVGRVTRHEHMKHRILNGLQTALAHVGWLAGHESSAEAANDPALTGFSRAFMAAQAATLDTPEGEDLDRYCAVTLARLQNPTIHHPLVQIGTDSSFKIVQRVADPAAELVAAGRPAPLHALTLAAWILYVGGRAPDGRVVPVSDPRRDELAALRRQAGNAPAALAAAYLGLPIFAPVLAGSPGFVAELAGAIGALQTGPVPEAAEAAVRAWREGGKTHA